ncbi:CheR family methyltransferase [Holophaga foetida]|uniref:CheR family methyltransferase n=1 Tax=Holophaga foetida TaxID=35839 RepID=UPI0002472A5A|nr:protein-glutamate O-methyltransferase CheR [Holophaga foetida]
MIQETISPNEFKLLRDYIEQHCGIALGEEKAYLVETRLASLLVETGCQDFGSFYRLAAANGSPTLRDRIVDAMTTNETLWFRDQHPFEILKTKLLPPLAEEVRSGSRFRIRIWSAASSTGQEPYSIAMTIQEFCKANPGIRPEHFEILATDISPSALFLAKAGRYDAAAIARGLPDYHRNTYFEPAGPVWTVKDSLKQMITYRRFNLQDPLDSLGKMDVVFCRYVAIYFSESFKRQIYSGIARILSPSGHLIISAVESLRGLVDDFEALSHANGTYYRYSRPKGAP